MKPIIIQLYSTHIEDFFDYQPEDPEDFGFPLSLIIGIEDKEGAENFEMMVATPRFIQKACPSQFAFLLRHYLIVFRYNFNEILDVINNYVCAIDEDSWEKVANKIGRIALWEFEDYQPYQPD